MDATRGSLVNSSRIMKYVIKIAKNPVALCCCLGVASSLAMAKLSGSLSTEAITERLKPMGQVNISGVVVSPAGAPAVIAGVGSPKDIYENNCKMCHQTGVAGAPKFGVAADWATRLSAQGLDGLVKTAISGIRAMPPKGNCLKCTPDDIKATVEYMLAASK